MIDHRGDDLVSAEHGHAAGGGAQHGVDDGEGHHGAVPGLRDGGLAAAVEGKEAEEEDEAAETRERHRVSGQVADGAVIRKSEQVTCNVVMSISAGPRRTCAAWGPGGSSPPGSRRPPAGAPRRNQRSPCSIQSGPASRHCPRPSGRQAGKPI